MDTEASPLLATVGSARVGSGRVGSGRVGRVGSGRWAFFLCRSAVAIWARCRSNRRTCWHPLPPPPAITGEPAGGWIRKPSIAPSALVERSASDPPMWWWFVLVDRIGAPSPPLSVRPRFGVRIPLTRSPFTSPSPPFLMLIGAYCSSPCVGLKGRATAVFFFRDL